MILIIFLVFVFFFYVTWILITDRKWSNILGILFALLILGSIGLTTANFHDHFGMKKVCQTTKTPIYSINKQANLILYKPIGTKSPHKVVIYKNSPGQQKPSVTKAIYTSNQVVKNANRNELVSKRYEWVYKNKFYQFLFGLAQPNEYAGRTNVFYVKRNMMVVTPEQAKALQAKMMQEKMLMMQKMQAMKK